MNKIKCLVVDDEELARTLLVNYIDRLPDLELMGQCTNPLEARAILQHQSIDLLFLDIQMPEMSGVEFLKTLAQQPFVVFTTAYKEYALEGYELNVVDYLLKPFSFERFVQAVNKTTDLLQLQQKANQSEKGERISTFKDTHILVKSEHKIYRILYQDISHIKSMREYVAFNTPNGRILSLGSLKKLEIDLPKGQFMRIHKSYIIATQKVTALEGNMVHIGKEKLPIGASYRETVLKKLF